MDFPSSKRQEKLDSKKKHTSKSVYTSKHIRIAAEISNKHQKSKSK